jgi:hypothetical protein
MASDTVAITDSEYLSDEYTDLPIDPKDTRSVSEYMKEDQTVRKFDNEAWKKVVGNSTFEEKPVKVDPPKKREPWFTMPTIDPQILRLISFTVIFILFAFILYYVVRNTSVGQSIRKMTPDDISKPVENIEEVDFDGLLRQALAEGDFRLAVRVHYLLLLKKLNEASLIVWKKNKTNRDYLSELYGRNAVYDDVRKLTLAYELVWYGERTVTQDSFQRISGQFESVNRQVIKDKPQE